MQTKKQVISCFTYSGSSAKGDSNSLGGSNCEGLRYRNRSCQRRRQRKPSWIRHNELISRGKQAWSNLQQKELRMLPFQQLNLPASVSYNCVEVLFWTLFIVPFKEVTGKESGRALAGTRGNKKPLDFDGSLPTLAKKGIFRWKCTDALHVFIGNYL